MDLLYHHGIYLIIFKVFNRLLDVPLVIYISLLMPLTYLLFFGRRDGYYKSNTAWIFFYRHLVYIFFQEMEMLDGSITGGI